MKERDERSGLRAEELETWLDGLMDEAHAAAFEARLAAEPELAREAELAGRIEASLRRTFHVPGAPAPSTHAGDPAGIGGVTLGDALLRPRRRARPVWVGAALLAAAALLVLLSRARSEAPPSPSPAEAPRDSLALGTPAPAPAAAEEEVRVGPLVESRSGIPLRRVTQPDLESLYSEAARLASRPGLSVCGPGEELEGALAKSYGQSVRLLPEMRGRLQGPFASEEWPTGMVLAGFSEEVGTVLVAERNTTLTCCLELVLPADSHLKLYTWCVGDVCFTEITPASEPRFLDSFAAAY